MRFGEGHIGKEEGKVYIFSALRVLRRKGGIENGGSYLLHSPGPILSLREE